MSLLYWNGYDLDRTLKDLPKFKSQNRDEPADWTIEDMIKFESAFDIVGKDFDRIKKMVSKNFLCFCYKLSV